MKAMTLGAILIALGLFYRQDPEEAACRAALASTQTRVTALSNELENMQIQRNLGLRERDAATEAVEVFKQSAHCEAHLLGIPVPCKVVFDGKK